MNSTSNIISEFIEGSKKAEELCKARGYSNGKYDVPYKKSNDGVFCNFTLFPGDSGVCKIGDNSSNSGGNKVGKPDKIIVFNYKVGKNSKKGIVKYGDQNPYYKISASMFRGFNIFYWGRFFVRFYFHRIIIPYVDMDKS